MLDIQLKEERVKIGGREYYIIAHPGRSGINLKCQLVKLVGPLLMGVLNQGSLESALKNSLLDLSDKEFNDLIINRLLKFTKCDGEEITELVFDKIFSAAYEELYELIFAVIKLNYGSLMGMFVKKNTGIQEMLLAVLQNSPLANK